MKPSDTPILVVGIGLDGAQGLTPELRSRVAQAKVLVGSDRHLSYFPDVVAERWPLGDFDTLAAQLRRRLTTARAGEIVVLASGDPLFFGLGRWLLQHLPAEVLTFHPHLSAVQLAFSRVKLPWQTAKLVSAHGRSLDALTQALQQGHEILAVLTDPTHTPAAIARLIEGLALPSHYRLWVCENLGATDERVRSLSVHAAQRETFAPLNVVILHRQDTPPPLPALPHFGLADDLFLSFRDRPGLITKRPVRVLALTELALQDGQVVWDIGAGTGSVSIEIARLCPCSTVYALEKTAVGADLIRQNAARFATPHVHAIHGQAPVALETLPPPDRVFIGGSGGNLSAILDHSARALRPGGRLVLALATLETVADLTQWLSPRTDWQSQWQQVQITRSVPVGSLTRWQPLNPVTLVTLTRADLSPAPKADE